MKFICDMYRWVSTIGFELVVQIMD